MTLHTQLHQIFVKFIHMRSLMYMFTGKFLIKPMFLQHDDTNDDPSWEHSRKNNYVVYKTRH